MKIKRWHQSESDYLRKHYPNTHGRKIAKFLNRSYRAVLNKALSLGLRKLKILGKVVGGEKWS